MFNLQKDMKRSSNMKVFQAGVQAKDCRRACHCPAMGYKLVDRQPRCLVWLNSVDFNG